MCHDWNIRSNFWSGNKGEKKALDWGMVEPCPLIYKNLHHVLSDVVWERVLLSVLEQGQHRVQGLVGDVRNLAVVRAAERGGGPVEENGQSSSCSVLYWIYLLKFGLLGGLIYTVLFDVGPDRSDRLPIKNACTYGLLTLLKQRPMAPNGFNFRANSFSRNLAYLRMERVRCVSGFQVCRSERIISQSTNSMHRSFFLQNTTLHDCIPLFILTNYDLLRLYTTTHY